MTVAQAKAALKAYGFDDNDPLNAWLDAGKQEIEEAFAWPFLQVINNAILVNATVSALVLPGTAFTVHSVRNMTDKQKLTYMDIVGFEREVSDPTTAGKPTIYTVTANTGIQLYPVPSVQTTFRVVYQDQLADINGLGDGATMPGPARIHYPTVVAAAAIALQADNEEERSQTAQGLRDSAISRLMRKYNTSLDEPRQVQDVMGYFG